jgi:hypothetical protein
MFVAIAVGIPATVAIVILLLRLPYNTLALVGVWRSAKAFNGPPALATAAQLLAAVWFAIMIIL